MSGPPGDDSGPVALGAFIRDQRRRSRLSMRKLAELAGVSNPYLSQIERGLRKPSAEILQQLARALSMSAEALYVQAGILEHRDGDVDVIGEILRDGSISRDQRAALVAAYRSYRAESGAPLPDDVHVDVDGDGDGDGESSGGERR